jgi:hypothetical protein
MVSLSSVGGAWWWWKSVTASVIVRFHYNVNLMAVISKVKFCQYCLVAVIILYIV